MMTFKRFKDGPHTEPLRQVPSHDAPPLAPRQPIAPRQPKVRHLQCDGEPPLEAIGNSSAC